MASSLSQAAVFQQPRTFSRQLHPAPSDAEKPCALRPLDRASVQQTGANGVFNASGCQRSGKAENGSSTPTRKVASRRPHPSVCRLESHAAIVSFHPIPPLAPDEFSDRFVSKGVAWQPKWRETLSLSPMRDKQVISDGSLSIVAKRRRQPRLSIIMCFPTGRGAEAARPLTRSCCRSLSVRS